MKKKYFLIILFLILAMLLVGCNGNGGITPPITPNQSPTASFTANPTSGIAPLEVAFTASSSSDSDGSIISYVWDFKDGNTGNGETVNHTFSSIGSYNVELTVTDNEGATDSTTKTITVTETPNQAPTASFTASPMSGVAPLEVSFNASNSSDSDGTIISYTWNFGDGSNGSGVTTSHIYENAGDYTVQLTVSDNNSASDSITMDIEVISGTIAGGIISSNTTWTIANSPYIIINEDLQIAQGATLLISEGVTVKFGEGRKLKVAGALKVEGSPDSPVTLTSIEDVDYWSGIDFLDISDITNSSLTNAIIENANIAILLGPAGVDLNFVGNVFRNNWQAIRGGSCENATFEGNTFLDNDQALALYKGSINSNLIVKNNLFINNWNATRGKYQNTIFENNTFSNNYTVFDEGLTAENWIQNNIFENNEEVFGCYDMFTVSISSQTYIHNNNFIDNNFVVRAPEIGCDGLTDISNNWWGTTNTNIIEDCIIDGKDDVELQIINYEPIENSEISNIGSSISIE